MRANKILVFFMQEHSLFKYAIGELKRLFPNAPFLGIREEKSGNAVEVDSLEELLDVCDKLRLLLEYYLDEESGRAVFITSHGGRLFVHECEVRELYNEVARIKELKENVV